MTQESRKTLSGEAMLAVTSILGSLVFGTMRNTLLFFLIYAVLVFCCNNPTWQADGVRHLRRALTRMAFLTFLFKTKETFQTQSGPCRQTYCGEVRCRAVTSQLPSLHIQIPHVTEGCCRSNSRLHGSQEENGQAAAQNSLIRPAMTHRVTTGRANRCLHRAAQARGRLMA